MCRRNVRLRYFDTFSHFISKMIESFDIFYFFFLQWWRGLTFSRFSILFPSGWTRYTVRYIKIVVMTAVGPATNVSRSTVQSPVKRLLPARTESILLLEIHDVSKTAASSAVNKPLNVEMNSRLHNCLLCFSPQQACQSLSSVIMGMARHMQSCQTKANCPPPPPPLFFFIH